MSEIEFATFPVLGFRVHAVQYADVLRQIEAWKAAGVRGRVAVVANTHVMIEGRHNLRMASALREAHLVLPDGFPLVLVGRSYGHRLAGRADGPGLTQAAMARWQDGAMRHYFFGGTPQVLERLRENLLRRWPGTLIAGMQAPPFRPLTPEEDEAAVRVINDSGADVLWVGLGCPKQEIWMAEHAARLQVTAMLGVGQAFDLLAGAKKRAPAWMCNAGLEWLYRLWQEPRRLWRRYLLYGVEFLALAGLERLRGPRAR